MALFEFHIHNHVDLDEVLKEIKNLKSTIMANFQEIKTQFEALKTAIAEERTQAQAKLAELQQSIDDLKANLQNGGTEEERTQLLADIQSQVNEVKAIIPDAPAPEPEA